MTVDEWWGAAWWRMRRASARVVDAIVLDVMGEHVAKEQLHTIARPHGLSEREAKAAVAHAAVDPCLRIRRARARATTEQARR